MYGVINYLIAIKIPPKNLPDFALVYFFGGLNALISKIRDTFNFKTPEFGKNNNVTIFYIIYKINVSQFVTKNRSFA